MTPSSGPEPDPGGPAHREVPAHQEVPARREALAHREVVCQGLGMAGRPLARERVIVWIMSAADERMWIPRAPERGSPTLGRGS
ncbi:hypothetical protein GCM10010486_16790 [Nonomuraea roseoviolacea subsp. carminata]